MFVGIFGAILGIMVADDYRVKKQHRVPEELYALSPTGALSDAGSWNRRAPIALAASGSVAVGLSPAGASGSDPERRRLEPADRSDPGAPCSTWSRCAARRGSRGAVA